MSKRDRKQAVLALVVSVATAASAAPLAGQSFPSAMRTAPVFATDTSLQAALAGIAARSAAWRAALDSVAVLGRMVLVVTPDEVVVVDDPSMALTDAFDSTSLAEAAPVVSTDGAVNVVMAVINLPLIRRLRASLRLTSAQYDADLERILIHEIYGHAVPYLLEGNVTGRCPDPSPGQPAVEACSIRRENEIRRELGLGLRLDYGVSGLALGRRGPGGT